MVAGSCPNASAGGVGMPKKAKKQVRAKPTISDFVETGVLSNWPSCSGAR